VSHRVDASDYHLAAPLSSTYFTGVRFSVLSSQVSVLSSQLSALSSQLSVLGSRFSVLGSRFSVLGSRFSETTACYPTPPAAWLCMALLGKHRVGRLPQHLQGRQVYHDRVSKYRSIAAPSLTCSQPSFDKWCFFPTNPLLTSPLSLI